MGPFYTAPKIANHVELGSSLPDLLPDRGSVQQQQEACSRIAASPLCNVILQSGGLPDK
jgi:hypothetical protein